MAHSYHAKSGTTFIYNSDLSGDVDIVREEGALTVPAKDLTQFAFEIIKRKLVGFIESLEPEYISIKVGRTANNDQM